MTILDGIGNELCSILHLEFRQQMGDVRLDRFLADKETFSDLAIRPPERHFPEHLYFTRREIIGWRARQSGSCGRGIDKGTATRHRTDSLQEQFRFGVFANVSCPARSKKKNDEQSDRL